MIFIVASLLSGLPINNWINCYCGPVSNVMRQILIKAIKIQQNCILSFRELCTVTKNNMAPITIWLPYRYLLILA